MSPNLAFFLEKGISVSLVALAIFVLSPYHFLQLFIILGHGHGFIAYLYQYRAKKITRTYLILFASLLALNLFTLLYLGRVDLIVFSVATLFLIHFLQDEVFLAGKKPALARTLEMLPVFLLYVGFQTDTVYRTSLLPYFAAAAAGILVIYAALLLRTRKLPDALSWYFLAIAGLLFTLFLAEIRVSQTVLIGGLVLLHYSTWYIQYFYKVRASPARLATYLRSVLACNLLAVGLYALYLTPFGKPWLYVLFAPAFFYIWTIQHIILSVRWRDWKGSLT